MSKEKSWKECLNEYKTCVCNSKVEKNPTIITYKGGNTIEDVKEWLK